MAKMVNYGDSLFLLGEIVRTVKDGLELEVEGSIFLDKLVEDIFFVESSLDKLYEQLKSSPLLIDRNEHLKNLMRTENLFADLLEGSTHERYRLSEELGPFHDRFEVMARNRRGRSQEVRDTIDSSEPVVGENGDMISPAEYEFLLVDTEGSHEGSDEADRLE